MVFKLDSNMINYKSLIDEINDKVIKVRRDLH